jgi:hypothetical protein
VHHLLNPIVRLRRAGFSGRKCLSITKLNDQDQPVVGGDDALQRLPLWMAVALGVIERHHLAAGMPRLGDVLIEIPERQPESSAAPAWRCAEAMRS